jgi:hypothetical protein
VLLGLDRSILASSQVRLNRFSVRLHAVFATMFTAA